MEKSFAFKNIETGYTSTNVATKLMLISGIITGY